MTKLEEMALSRTAGKGVSLGEILQTSQLLDGNIFAKWSAQAATSPKAKSGKSDATDVTGWMQSKPGLSFSLAAITI